MKNIVQLVIVLTLTTLSSCQLQKKQKLSTKQQSEKLELQTERQHYAVSKQSQLLLTDSNHSDYTVWLWPKGNFTFSIKNGFAGQAERLVVQGKQVHKKILGGTNNLNKDSTIMKAKYHQIKQQSTSVAKTKINFGPNWVWVLLAFIFLSYLVYRRLKQLS